MEGDRAGWGPLQLFDGCCEIGLGDALRDVDGFALAPGRGVVGAHGEKFRVGGKRGLDGGWEAVVDDGSVVLVG